MITTGFNIVVGIVVISAGLYLRYTTKSGEDDLHEKKIKHWRKK
jgi:hypothetical protein